MISQWLPAPLLRLGKKIAAQVLIYLGMDSARYKKASMNLKLDRGRLADPAEVDGYKDEGEEERVERLVDLIISRVPRPRAVLDVGCGTGRYLKQMRKVSPDSLLEGIDISPEILEKYARPMVPGARFYALDIETDPVFYRDNALKYDLVCLIGIVQVLARRRLKDVLLKVRHMCADGGVLYIQINVETPQKQSSFGYKRYAIRELSLLLEECGFYVKESGRTDILADYAYIFAGKITRRT
jgi:SAM-dependent methyltransferase